MMNRWKGMLGAGLLAFALSFFMVPAVKVWAAECVPPVACQARCGQIYDEGTKDQAREDFMATCTFVNCDAQGYFHGAMLNYNSCLEAKAAEDKKAQEEADKARLEEARKNEELKKAGKPYVTKVEFGKEVKAGDTVKAKRNETVVIVYPDGAEIRLMPYSTMRLTSYETVDLIRGKALFMVDFLEWKAKMTRKKFEVRFSGGAGAVRGTKFQVSATTTSGTFRVIEGVVEVTNLKGDKAVEVMAGYSVVARRNGKISKPKSFDAVKLAKELGIGLSTSK